MALSRMFHARFLGNPMTSERLSVSMFFSILMDLVSNLTVNLDFLSFHLMNECHEFNAVQLDPHTLPEVIIDNEFLLA